MFQVGDSWFQVRLTSERPKMGNFQELSTQYREG